MVAEFRVVRGEERIGRQSGDASGAAFTDGPNRKQTDVQATILFPAGLRPPRPSRRGFTLIELLVVIAIVALLVAILSPSMSRVRLLAQRTECLARQRGIGQALSSYASDHAGTYPIHKLSGMVWADAYGLRRDHPYTGATDRPPLGLGLLVSTGVLPITGLGEVIHCPSLNNLGSEVAPGHCMDVANPCGYGGSGWSKYPNHRIIGGFNYRGTSYGWVYTEPLRMYKVGGDCVMLTDTPDWRFRGQRSLYNAHGGYNCIFADGGGSFLADPEYEVDELVQAAGGRVDGRGVAVNDEIIFEYMGSER